MERAGRRSRGLSRLPRARNGRGRHRPPHAEGGGSWLSAGERGERAAGQPGAAGTRRAGRSLSRSRRASSPPRPWRAATPRPPVGRRGERPTARRRSRLRDRWTGTRRAAGRTVPAAGPCSAPPGAVVTTTIPRRRPTPGTMPRSPPPARAGSREGARAAACTQPPARAMIRAHLRRSIGGGLGGPLRNLPQESVARAKPALEAEHSTVGRAIPNPLFTAHVGVFHFRAPALPAQRILGGGFGRGEKTPPMRVA